jgi:GNAT superfamily N-acetyltransferase
MDETGGLYVTAEQLAKFGDGDAARGRRELRNYLATDQDGPVFNGPTARPSNVRIATPNDEAALVELFAEEVAEVAAFMGPVDNEKILEVIQVGTRSRGGFVGVIDGPEKTPIAATVLHPQQWWFSNGWYYLEICLFVHPDHRRAGRYSSDLLDFQRWVVDEHSRHMGYRVYLLCGVLGARRTRSKIALYRRKFAQAGAAFVYPSPFTAARSK